MERGFDPGKKRGAFNSGSRGKGPGLCGGGHGGNSAEDKGLKHHRRKRHTGSKRAVPERQYGHYGSPGSIKGRRGNTKRDCPGIRKQRWSGCGRNKGNDRREERQKNQGRGNQGSQCVRYRHNRRGKRKCPEASCRKDD